MTTVLSCGGLVCSGRRSGSSATGVSDAARQRISRRHLLAKAQHLRRDRASYNAIATRARCRCLRSGTQQRAEVASRPQRRTVRRAHSPPHILLDEPIDAAAIRTARSSP